MLNDHSKVGIALIIFYVPAILLAAWLLFHRHAHGKGNDRPRLAWIVLLIFSLSAFLLVLDVSISRISQTDHSALCI